VPSALAPWIDAARRWCGADPPPAVIEQVRGAAAATAPRGTLSAALAALAGSR
jgi:hypothetical protein